MFPGGGGSPLIWWDPLPFLNPEEEQAFFPSSCLNLERVIKQQVTAYAFQESPGLAMKLGNAPVIAQALEMLWTLMRQGSSSQRTVRRDLIQNISSKHLWSCALSDRPYSSFSMLRERQGLWPAQTLVLKVAQNLWAPAVAVLCGFFNL